MLKHQDRTPSVTECGCKVLKPWFLRMEMFTYFFISNKSFVDYLTLVRSELSYRFIHGVNYSIVIKSIDSLESAYLVLNTSSVFSHVLWAIYLIILLQFPCL